MDLQTLCNWIILIGGTAVAINQVLKFIQAPGKFFKNKKKDYQQELATKITEILEEVLPDLLLKHDLETREKYRADRERYLHEIKQQVLEENRSILNDIEAKSIAIQQQLTIMNQSAKDVLRQKIMATYHKGRLKRELSIYDREAVDELYKDYKKQGGNSYIDKYYARMANWEVIHDEEDEDIM